MLFFLVALACAPAENPAPDDLDLAFSEASRDLGVPRDLLVAISYASTRIDQRDGAESAQGRVGLMDLRIDDQTPSVRDASEALGIDIDAIVNDPVANVRGGAAVLAGMARHQEERTGEPVDTMQEWYPIVARYAGVDDPLLAEGFADQVYSVMESGAVVETWTGDWIELSPRVFTWRDAERVPTTGSGLVDQYVPASTANYTDASRGVGDIDMVVIHTTEGSYAGSISWFQNSAAQGSAHYVIRSSDGEITQTVDEEDIAWHAGDWTTNQRAIGIEHEGYVAAPETWYTDAMYRSSAALTRDICDRYGIPIDRNHIIGHYEVPGCASGSGGGASCHTDPGSGWDWDYYMELVQSDGGSTAIITGGLDDGPRGGSFQAVATSSRLGVTDTCSGPVSGSVSGGVFYVTATCTLDDNGDRVDPLPVTFTGSVSSGTTVDGRVAVDGYADSWSGTLSGDGGVYAEWSGTHDLGGDVGVLTYSAILELDP